MPSVTPAKQLAPVDTGALRDSITAGMHSDGLGASIGPTVDYGTTTKAPRPFLAPAADRHAEDFRQAVERLGSEVL